MLQKQVGFFFNFCNMGTRRWFWWAETCSTLLYSNEVLFVFQL